MCRDSGRSWLAYDDGVVLRCAAGRQAVNGWPSKLENLIGGGLGISICDESKTATETRVLLQSEDGDFLRNLNSQTRVYEQC